MEKEDIKLALRIILFLILIIIIFENGLPYISFNWPLLLEYLKVITWPLIVLYFLWVFRDSLELKIKSLTKMDAAGVHTEFAKEAEEQINLKDEIAGETEIEKSVKKKETEIKSQPIKTDDELVGKIAVLEVKLNFERIYRIIFGSQIKLLEDLRLAGSKGILGWGIYKYFKQAGLEEIKDYSFTNYIGFLKNQGLINSVQFKENLESYTISQKGKDFLDYIETLQYSKEKPL